MSTILNRKSAAVMFTDIVKATDMMAKDEERALALLKEKKTILKLLIDKHDGIYVKGTGDGSLSYFDSPYKASLCAQIFQQNIYDRDDLNVRVGIHVGDIVFEEGDVFGDGVNVAKRLESMAPEGGICVSNSVYDELRNKKEFDGVDLGLQTLKGIGRLVEVFGLKGDKINAPNPSNYHENKVQVHTHDEVPSVAIIPFRNKGKEEEEFYAYGICSELISDVSSAGLIRVASLEKIMELSELSASEKAKELNVRYITTGMLWKMGEMFQLSIELYDTKDTKVIWSDQWQEHWDNLPNIKANLSTGLLKALNTENNVKTSSEIVSPEAYKYYLEAQYKFDNYKDKKEIVEIRNLLNKSLLQDPNIIDSKWLIAKLYFRIENHQEAIDRSFRIIKEAKIKKEYNILCQVYLFLASHYALRREFNKAIEYNTLAKDLSKEIDNKNMLGWTYEQFLWIYAESGINFDEIEQQADYGLAIFEDLEDSSGKAHIHFDLSFYNLCNLGNLNKALDHANIASKIVMDVGGRIDKAISLITFGHHYMFRGEFEKGDNYLNQCLNITVDRGDKTWTALAHQILGESLYLQGKYQESLIYFEKSFNLAEKINLKLWRFGSVLGKAINRKKMEKNINRTSIIDEINEYNLEGPIEHKKERNFHHNYCYYIIFEEKKYLQLSYDRVIKIANKLNIKDKKIYLNCTWPKLIIKEWEKNK